MAAKPFFLCAIIMALLASCVSSIVIMAANAASSSAVPPWGITTFSHHHHHHHHPLLPAARKYEQRRRRRGGGGARFRFIRSALLPASSSTLLGDYHDEIETTMSDEEYDSSALVAVRRRRRRRKTRFVAKTVESFKLADLYWLESRVMSHYCQRSSGGANNDDNRTAGMVGQLAFHRPTASHLLCWDYYCHDTSGNGNNHHRNNGGISPPDGIDYSVDMDDGDRSSNRLLNHPPLVSSSSTIMEEAVFLPFRPGRFQYAARIIAMGQTPQQLLDDIIIEGCDSTITSWTLEYDTFEPLRNNRMMHPQQPHSFHPTMLLCAASRILPGEPLLLASSDAQKSPVRQGKHVAYVIIETRERLYLAQKLPSCEAVGGALLPAGGNDVLQSPRRRFGGLTYAIADRFRSSWANRPFQYSGAINIDAAFVIIDILGDVALRRRGKEEDTSGTTVRMLDPTCGSGTFLAMALMAWGDESNANARRNVEVVGIDSNPKCAAGTVRNLRHLFRHHFTDENAQSFGDGVGKWSSDVHHHSDAAPAAPAAPPSLRATIHAGDSIRLGSFVTGDKFDCAVANLPWNRNTFEYQTTRNDDDECASASGGILEATAAALKPGAPLVVVSGGHHRDEEPGGRSSFDARTCLEKMGFLVFGEASIPPRGFKLPASGKKGDAPESVAKNGKVQRTSDCLITVAIAPEGK